MMTAWVSFATHGDPGWPTYDTSLVQLFDAESSVGPYPETVSRDIWRDDPQVLDLL